MLCTFERYDKIRRGGAEVGRERELVAVHGVLSARCGAAACGASSAASHSAAAHASRHSAHTCTRIAAIWLVVALS